MLVRLQCLSVYPQPKKSNHYFAENLVDTNLWWSVSNLGICLARFAAQTQGLQVSTAQCLN